jgi:hypothetical protein
MPSIEARKALLLDYEQRFANELGLAMIPKPKMKVWMVLIPMYFFFHIYRHKKYMGGRRIFAANFMASRYGIADETMEALRQNRPVNLDVLSTKSKLPSEETQRSYREWLTLLMAHYRDLLTAQGDDFDALVKLAYRNRSNYLLTLDQLSGAEKKLNTAMRPHIKNATEDIDDVIAGIEHHSTRLRQAHAQTVFPDP